MIVDKRILILIFCLDAQIDDYEDSQDNVVDLENEDEDVTIEQDNDEGDAEEENEEEIDDEDLQVEILNEDETTNAHTESQGWPYFVICDGNGDE